MLLRLLRNRRGGDRRDERLSFRCNVCGAPCVAPLSQLDRETPSCRGCGSTVRFRSIVRALSVELFGESLALPDFPIRRDLRGLGMSDWDGYAERLAQIFDYTNTYYHREPRLDITDIPASLESSFDFVVSSDVFEHVPPPVGVAFRNARRLLKPGGVLVFSVPYTKGRRTVEHFPDLYDYRIAETRRGPVLHNTTRAGESQTFDRLVFHGGPGQTLEMRVFSESSLVEEFERAGFGRVRIYRDADLQHGIYLREDWSLPLAARAS